MDPLFKAYNFYRMRKFDKCTQVCSEILKKNPYDQATWALKMRCLTEEVYMDEVEMDEEGVAELILEENSIAQVARPGTSLRKTATSNTGVSPAIRPVSQSGRPLSGYVRPGTQQTQPNTVEQALRTSRTSHTARPISASSGRYIRLGTASIVSTQDGPFINLAHLQFSKYAAIPNIAKSLFEYIFYHEGDIKNALEFAAQASTACQLKDWWWKIQLAKCYFRLRLYRDCEKQLKSAIKQQPTIDGYLYLSNVYVKIDQPLTAIETYKQGLEKFPDDVFLHTGIARIHEALGNLDDSIDQYKHVLKFDAMNIEAIACLATHHFYTDQPEIAMKLYRRLVMMGVNNPELYNNLGMCCFFAQQYDMTLTCLSRAITLATEDNVVADIWYNISHIALSIGDTVLAYQCLRLALSYNNDHAEAYNNLGVLELNKGHPEQARAFLQASFVLAPHLFEPHYNFASLAEKVGDLHSSYISVKRAVEAFKQHSDSRTLLERLQKQFTVL